VRDNAVSEFLDDFPNEFVDSAILSVESFTDVEVLLTVFSTSLKLSLNVYTNLPILLVAVVTSASIIIFKLIYPTF